MTPNGQETIVSQRDVARRAVAGKPWAFSYTVGSWPDVACTWLYPPDVPNLKAHPSLGG